MFESKGYFKPEAILMMLLPFILIIIGIITGFFGPRLMKQLDIDSCLDSGGKYDYETSECVGRKE